MDRKLPSPAVERLLREFAGLVGADGITLWMAEAGFLVAVANPLEPEIAGIRQPLDSGLVSQVYLTGQAILEEDLPSHPSHDPAVDRTLGRRCRSMMAAPVDNGGNGGVVSVVKLEGAAGGFSLVNLGKLVSLARTIGKPSEEVGW